MGGWVSPRIRDEVVDFVSHYSLLTGLALSRLVGWVGIGRDKFYGWRQRYGLGNDHNALVPRDFWLEEWEKRAIIAYRDEHPDEGYRRLTYMMLDANVVAVSPSSTYRVLKEAGAMRKWNGKESKKGTGFVQPLRAHEHWHVDVSYINICGTFYYFCGLLDGFSRFIVHWEIREAMKESDIEIIIERAKEKFPAARPRVISDNGPQFIARDFKEFIRLSGMTHVRTSPFYPQSNGKLERFHKTLKSDCIRPKTPLSLEDARRMVVLFIGQYNNERLHSAIGYIAPRDKLEGRAAEIFAERKRKLHEASERRKARFGSQEATARQSANRVAFAWEPGRAQLLLTYTE
jgi:putative transposase